MHPSPTRAQVYQMDDPCYDIGGGVPHLWYLKSYTSDVIPIFGSVHQKYKIQASTIYPKCKPVVLVTLGGCHLLDGLVVVSVEARKEDCAVLRKRDCEGYCAHPAGALVERVIKQPSLGSWGSCGAQCVGLVGDPN